MPRAWKYADDVNTDEIVPARGDSGNRVASPTVRG
jgi:3-isopropylmalate dehydratase small subunit